ncbi:helix-turn-helix domain-containing protein [Nitrospira sp. T9]|uniref:helix-turn-helix domain-containing protein n=1 Tax=unclassified Nitrospira TaxID=2652172 RepID=UPI003F978A46
MKQPSYSPVESRLISEQEAAQYLGISYWTIRNLRFRGELPSIKIHRRILIDRQDLDAYISRLKKVEGP